MSARPHLRLALLSALGLFGTSSALSACNYTLMPELAGDSAKTTATIEVRVETTSLDTVDPAIEALEVEIVDVLLHRAEDDAWVITNAAELEADLVDPYDAGSFTTIPLGVDSYDRLMLVFDDARLLKDGEWRDVEITTPRIEIDVATEIENTGNEIEIVFDMLRTLDGGPIGGWEFEPKVTVVGSESADESGSDESGSSDETDGGSDETDSGSDDATDSGTDDG